MLPQAIGLLALLAVLHPLTASGTTKCPGGRFVVIDDGTLWQGSQIRIDVAPPSVAVVGIEASTASVRATGHVTHVRASFKVVPIAHFRLTARLRAPDCSRLAGQIVLLGKLPPPLARHRVQRIDAVRQPDSPPDPPTCSQSDTGPQMATLTSLGAGGDLDLGWSGAFHNFSVPAGLSLRACLAGCAPTGRSRCDVAAVPSATLGPPLPLLAAGVPLCVVAAVDGSTRTGRLDLADGSFDIPVRLRLGMHVTSKAAVCPSCEDGACDGGASAGAPCRTDAEMPVVAWDGVTRTYRLSRDCLPAGAEIRPDGLAIEVGLTSGTTSLPGETPCAGVAAPVVDACDDAGCGAACTGAACVAHAPDPIDPQHDVCVDAKGGVAESCCVSAPDRPCFPTGDGAITRTGLALPPRSFAGASWPEPTYPKETQVIAAAVGCIGESSSTVDTIAGLPGPIALSVPFRLRVQADGDAAPWR